MNNIFAGTSTIAENTTTTNLNRIKNFCFNNIIGSGGTSPSYSYYTSGVPSGTPVSTVVTDFATFINLSALSNPGTPGSQHHEILKLNDTNHPIIDKEDNLDEVGFKVWDTEGFSNLIKDQLGKVRPQSRSLGSVDVAGFQVLDGDIRRYYNSGVPSVPTDTVIDLWDYIRSHPPGGTVAFEIVTPPTNGTVSLSNDSKVTFHPELPYNPISFFTFRVSTNSNGRLYEDTATVRIQVLDLNLSDIANLNLPGYDGAKDIDTHCKIEMKRVEFNPRYKFITGAFNNNIISEGDYDGIKVSNDDHSGQVYDYHIPLVGDLNGDGRPEIVALGMITKIDTAINFMVTVDAIHIFNGQTGKRLLTYSGADVPSFKPYGDGYHGSPGAMALINSDGYLGDKEVEVILAVGQTANTATSKRLFSYVIHYDESTEGWSMTKNPKWNSNPPYANDNNNTPDFSTPIIQIVDFNKDGKAEILAYNKIFDAETGEKLLTYGTLKEDPEDVDAAYVGRDFKGRESQVPNNTEKGNSKIGFAYVYDLDGDGEYEICAGGKVYYNLDLNQNTCETLNIMDKLPVNEKAWLQGNGVKTGISAVRAFTDARTAVADIDGDGIPEIVASYYVESNFISDGIGNNAGSANKLRIVVWNAQLDKSTPANSTATLKAILNIPLSNYGVTGTYSYMYIADIDGKKQRGQKLPEISILGPMFYCYLYGNSWAGYPVHPNVADSMAVSYPRTGEPTDNSENRAKGSLISFTWDNTPGVSVFDRLKVSFMMEHSDESVNTGISLFDFDNDGVNEICYRDERRLRIIRPIVPFVALRNTNPDVTIFQKPVESNTGFEYPVIVDLDGDYSGDMLVSGSEKKSTRDFLYAVQGANVDLAPARTVWNQFMYSPMKITDSLQVPQPPKFPPHPLSPAAAFYKDADDSYETYIYNMNIGQVPYFSVDGSGGKSVYAPLVKIPNAVISDLKFAKADVSTKVDTIQFVISNAGEAAINVNTPIKIYKGRTASSGAIYYEGNVGSAVYTGENITIKVPLKTVADNAESFLIRVCDDSFETVGGITKGDVFEKPEVMSSFTDCDWTNNWDVLSYFYLRADYYTVLPGETVVLDVLGNDILTRFSPAVKTIKDFTVVPAPGNTLPIPEVVNQKLQFTAPVTGGLVCYIYNYTDEPLLPAGYIYIYVAELETPPNTLLCGGQNYTLKVKSLPVQPEEVTFEYYESDDDVNPISGNPTFPASDTSFYVKPLNVITDVPTPNTSLSGYLPPKRINFKVSTSTSKMKWTGLTDTNWHNPNNWKEVDASGKETPVTYYPSSCVDVIIPSGAKYYPELTAPASCANIKMGDRAMIAGIHHLNYQTAEVEFKLNADERDRFVMWSAPLKSMYSGDYHFEEGTSLKSGDVYMNLFQHANPDGTSVAAVNSFTATFGSLDEPLPLGKAFNLKVTNTSGNKDKSFVFPQTAASYTDVNSQSYDVSLRTDGSKFITYGKPATFNMDVVNDINGSALIQVVNPYMAYLDVNKFLTANSGRLSTTTYAIWDGQITSGFQQIGTIGDLGNRFVVSTIPSNAVSPSYIPPLQSFFVQKTGETTVVGTVSMSSSDWTTTTPGSPYKLRAGAQETNILRIKAVQDKRVSYAVLHYNESTSPAYNSKEDMHKLFYQLEDNVIPLEVYSFAPTREALAINSSSDFSQHIPLGLRTDKAGSVTLEFSGMATFGHNVYLIDHAQNNKETDLQKNPAYVFTVTKKSATDKVIELNDRFSLRTTYTGIGLDSETIGITDLNVTSRDGYIYVQTPSPVSSLQVYSLTGALVYSSAMRSDYFRIQADGQQAYIVKVKLNEDYLTQKVFVK
ncbi:MAG: hypothetical protein LBU37_11420 [Tannerellaceae bacterium]|nr:hypothetical protein [Tannerellaceae bacterium]